MNSVLTQNSRGRFVRHRTMQLKLEGVEPHDHNCGTPKKTDHGILCTRLQTKTSRHVIILFCSQKKSFVDAPCCQVSRQSSVATGVQFGGPLVADVRRCLGPDAEVSLIALTSHADTLCGGRCVAPSGPRFCREFLFHDFYGCQCVASSYLASSCAAAGSVHVGTACSNIACSE